ncbi:MAG: hypothetical protein M5R40_00535 [Anaerolineae bacterium]|nr:hypothetical protein [Anaerolineae bacterium]
MAQEPVIRINAPYIRNIYLSCSWQRDVGQSASWLVVRDLDRCQVRAVGDVRGLAQQDPARIARIMGGCSGLVCVLPPRQNPFSTSEYILQEVAIAVRLGLPVALFVEADVRLQIEEEGETVRLRVPNLDMSTLHLTEDDLTLSRRNYYGAFAFEPASREPIDRQLEGKIEGFADYLRRIPQGAVSEPYAVALSRVRPDFALARQAIRAAVERQTGLPCLWSHDDERYATGIESIRQRTTALLQHAEFIVADVSRKLEAPFAENETVAFELGEAVAFDKEIFVSYREVSNFEPYFAIADMQLHGWDTEQALYDTLCQWLEARKERISRHIYNHDLADGDFTPHVAACPAFVYDRRGHYHLEILSVYERVLIAVSLSALVFSGAQLFEAIFNFSASYDLLAVVASIIALFFASSYSRFQAFLARNRPARYAIYAAAVFMLAAYILYAVSNR